MEEKLTAKCTCKDCKKADWDGVHAVYCMESGSYWDKDDFCSKAEKDNSAIATSFTDSGVS